MRLPEEEISQLCEGSQHGALEHEVQLAVSLKQQPGEELESRVVEFEEADKVLKQR